MLETSQTVYLSLQLEEFIIVVTILMDLIPSIWAIRHDFTLPVSP